MMLPFRLLWSLLCALVARFTPSKPKDISGRVVLITGAASGIGQELAYKFALFGVKLALVDLNEKGLLETKEHIENKGVTCRTYLCDISKSEQVQELGTEIRKDFKTVDILINNAGVVNVKNFLRLKESEIRQVIEVNLLGTIWMCKEFLPDMSERNDGHIVNMASVAGVCGFPLAVPYCASKFGVKGFSEALAADLERLGKTGVYVSIVYPGPVDTPLIHNLGDAEIILGDDKLLRPDGVAKIVANGVLINKRHIFIPDAIWRLAALSNLLPVETMQIISHSKKYGFYEK